MKIHDIFITSAFALCAPLALGQTYAEGGQFKDRILPMQGSQTAQEGTPVWGASGVQGRYLDNGAEPASDASGNALYSYWGGNVIQDENGKYHMFLAGWDATKNGHNYWPNSDIYHVTSDNYYGPFTLTENFNIGKGHNPEVYKAADGTYVIYVLRDNKWVTSYQSSSLDGPWKETALELELNGRDQLGGDSWVSNFTFAPREDGSVLAISRGGGVWVSRDGKSPFVEISDKCVYPSGINGAFEDPVVWYDGYQYHHIVNDWRGCKAYYSRSIDGVN